MLDKTLNDIVKGLIDDAFRQDSVHSDMSSLLCDLVWKSIKTGIEMVEEWGSTTTFHDYLYDKIKEEGFKP